MSKMRVIDLLNKIANGEIKEGQRFNINFGDMYRKCYFTTDEDKEYCGGLDFFKNCSDNYSVYDSLTLNEEVELIEEEPEIDIQELEELEVVSECEKNLKDGNPFGNIIYRVKEPRLVGLAVNQLIKAVKQLDNQINNK